MRVGAEIPATVDQRRRGERSSIESINAQEFVFRTRLKHERFTRVFSEEDLSADRHRRSRKALPLRLTQAPLPCQVAGFGFVARRHTYHVVDDVKIIPVEQRGGYERRSLVSAPGHARGRDIPRPTRPDREGWTGTPRRAVDQAMPHRGCGSDFNQIAVATPELAAGLRIISIDAPLARDDDLVAFTGAYGDGRTPSHLLLASFPPQRLSGTFIKGRHERKRGTPLILIDDDSILIQEWRASGSVIGVQFAKAAMPNLLPLEVHTQQAVVAEIGVNALAVGTRGARGIAVLAIGALGRCIRGKCLPEQFPIRSPQAEN